MRKEVLTLDSLSLKILKELKSKPEPVSEKELIFLFGKETEKSLNYLCSEKYITQGIKYGGITRDPVTGRATTVNCPNGMYSISAFGKDFLQHFFLNEFDKWITRIAAFVGAVTGIISLILHVT